jgi:hypothetical protein
MLGRGMHIQDEGMDERKEEYQRFRPALGVK